ncbi:MAG: decarboxylase [Nanoarchaeota archaeon]|nr:decarboxylase [Nanoarchaeota archaeon]MBU1703791.1 decarboxylase [Nanoarchaeota archaeon]
MIPKFILSRGKVLEQYNKVKHYCDTVSYSSKTNQDVTKLLESETDSMFSVHLVNELKHITDKSRVIFLAQAWDNKLISSLLAQEIKWFVVDNEADLDILLGYLEKNHAKINLLLRIKLKENTIRTEKYFVFGMDSETVNRRLKELRKNPNITNLGIHFHRKTQNMAEWNLKYEISNIIDDLNLLDVVNIGGGIPAEYANTNVKVIGSIFNKLSEFKEFLKEKCIQMIIEPGRFIAAPALRLVTSIVSVNQHNVTVNASVYNTDMDAIIVPVKLLIEGERQEGTPYAVKGCTPCSMDLFRYKVYLDDPKVGDMLVFLNAGAYNFASDFCDLEKLPTEVVE